MTLSCGVFFSLLQHLWVFPLSTPLLEMMRVSLYLLSLIVAAQPAVLPIFLDSLKLDGVNFLIWKMKIVSILHSYGHYTFVTTLSERPVVGMVGATQATLDSWNDYQLDSSISHPQLPRLSAYSSSSSRHNPESLDSTMRDV